MLSECLHTRTYHRSSLILYLYNLMVRNVLKYTLQTILLQLMIVSQIATAPPQPVSSVTGTLISPSNISVSWTQSIITTGTVVPVSYYIITYFNITCPSQQYFTDSGSITVNSPLTSTLIPLQSGQLYNISVRASNAVGVSPAVSETFWTLASESMTMNYTM